MLKTKKFRRLLAGLLAVLMLSVCLPVGAFANEGDTTEPEAVVTLNFYEAGNDSNVLYESKTVEVQSIANSANKYVMDLFADVTRELAGKWDYDHFENAYNPGSACQAGTLIVPGKMTYNVYYKAVETTEPEAVVTLNFYEAGNDSNVLYESKTVEVQSIADSADKYVMDLFADVTRELAGKWDYDHFENAYNPGSACQAGTLIVPGKMTYNVYYKAVEIAPQSADYTFTFVNERTGETIHDALDVHVEDVAASVDKYVTDLFADVRLDLENDGYKFAGIRNAYNPDDYAQVTSKVVPGGPYEYIVCFTDDAKVEPADYTFTFVDVANGAEIREYLPVHIADVNTSVDKYVLDLVADARRTLEDNGWVYEGIKNAFNPDEYAQDESLIVPGGPYEYIVCFSKPSEAENVTVNFEFVDMAGNAIMAGTSHTVPYSDDVTGTKVVDVIVDETAELANHSYVLDHMTWVYSDGSESSELKDPVVVPDYDNTTIKVYYAQPAHYTFTFVNDETREEIEDVLTVDIADVKTNVDTYVLDLVAEVRRGLEDDGWTYAGIRNAYNDEEFAQNESLVVPGGPYEYLVCFTKENVEDPTTPSTGDNTTTVTGKDEHPDIAEAKANGTWGAPTATPAAASTIPQTGDSMPVVMLIVIALVAAGAVGGLVVLRKRSHQ